MRSIFAMLCAVLFGLLSSNASAQTVPAGSVWYAASGTAGCVVKMDLTSPDVRFDLYCTDPSNSTVLRQQVSYGALTALSGPTIRYTEQHSSCPPVRPPFVFIMWSPTGDGVHINVLMDYENLVFGPTAPAGFTLSGMTLETGCWKPHFSGTMSPASGSGWFPAPVL